MTLEPYSCDSVRPNQVNPVYKPTDILNTSTFCSLSSLRIVGTRLELAPTF